jgi:hypothetical protein
MMDLSSGLESIISEMEMSCGTPHTELRSPNTCSNNSRYTPALASQRLPHKALFLSGKSLRFTYHCDCCRIAGEKLRPVFLHHVIEDRAVLEGRIEITYRSHRSGGNLLPPLLSC